MEAKELKKMMEGKDKQVGCLCCPETADVLLLTTKLYSGFGGWSIIKDGEVIFSGDDFDEWDSITELRHFEKMAKKEPSATWQAYLYLPLREAKYQRSDCGKWILIETGPGFA